MSYFGAFYCRCGCGCRCEKCTDTNLHVFSCSWCVYTSTCVDTVSSSCANGDTKADTIEMCPFLSNTSTPNLVHSQVPTDIMLTGRFLPQPRVSYISKYINTLSGHFNIDTMSKYSSHSLSVEGNQRVSDTIICEVPRDSKSQM